jgi:hypothetical protein
MTRTKKRGDHGFAVVVGPRGSGMTAALETAAESLSGVITSDTCGRRNSKDVIVKKVLQEIIGPLWKKEESEFQNKKRALDVIKAYQNISEGQSPIVIIEAYADVYTTESEQVALTTSGSSLSEEFHLNVVIEATQYSLPDNLKGLEDILVIKPMTDSMMRQLPEFIKLSDYLVSTGNDKIVLSVCGGCPLLLKRLTWNFKDEGMTKIEVEQAVRKFIATQLADASVYISRISYAPLMKSVSLFVYYNELVKCFQ